MKRALVLSGGGAKGAFQVGVLKWMSQFEDLRYDIFCGISVGALNAAYLAQFKNWKEGIHDLERLWLSLRGNKDIYKRWKPFGKLHYLWQKNDKASWYNSEPLWDLVKKNFDDDMVRMSGKTLRVGAVRFKGGVYKLWNERSPDLYEGILASSAFPQFFRPIMIDGELWVDGGIRDIIPFQAAIDAGATHIDVISASPAWHVDPLPDDPKGWHLGKQTLDIMSSEIKKGDIEKMKLTPNVRYVEPKLPVLKNSLDHDPLKIRENIHKGYLRAQEVLSLDEF